MKTLKLVGDSTNPLAIIEEEIPIVPVGCALVKIEAAALNRRDYWICEGKYPGIKENITLGSDACGIVEKVEGEEGQTWIGKEVLINPNINWGTDEKHQAKDYSILGMPDNGTFAEYIVVGIDRLVEKPSHLKAKEAGALPLAGLTAYRAVRTQGEIGENDVVLISGFGGGVAQFAFQFCIALGAKVFVTTSNAEKLKKAKDLGATNGVNYKEENWDKQLKEMAGGFSHIIDSAGGDQVNTLLKLMKPAGRYVFYGASLGLPSNIDMYRIFYNQLRIQGTTMGSDSEFTEMVNFVNEHNIIPIVDSVIPFEKALTAFEKMKNGTQMGKLVLTFEDGQKESSKLEKSVTQLKSFVKGLFKK